MEAALERLANHKRLGGLLVLGPCTTQVETGDPDDAMGFECVYKHGALGDMDPEYWADLHSALGTETDKSDAAHPVGPGDVIYLPIEGILPPSLLTDTAGEHTGFRTVILDSHRRVAVADGRAAALIIRSMAGLGVSMLVVPGSPQAICAAELAFEIEMAGLYS
ncbi:hypothetical protein KIPB_002378 [Kipferlia bialata]|uniref:Uncharacterized protein n=1 Tax=Kipferlia bialata TaxID=797122 RepID=A0A9K3CQE4_9EUKA|nr:hypothetical protein KIPB_002378 [Kipferlia bialata]|eukprot:g2378.t1